MINNYQEKQFDLITFGEILGRISVKKGHILRDGEEVVLNFAGAESTVASLVATFGQRVSILTKVPYSSAGVAIQNMLMSNGVNVNYVIDDLSPTARAGIYYSTPGGYPRKPKVEYDRCNSSFANMTIDELPKGIFSSTKMFHTSGISLGIQPELTKELLQRFKREGTIISFDVNYRANIWPDESKLAEALLEIIPYVDIFFCSKETFEKTFQMTGDLKKNQKDFALKHDIRIVVSTIRTIKTAALHDFDSILYDLENDIHFQGKPYKNIHVCDRIGSGDAYVAGFLYYLMMFEDCDLALKFANAVSADANTIYGDCNPPSFEHISKIIKDHESSEKGSEMSR